MEILLFILAFQIILIFYMDIFAIILSISNYSHILPRNVTAYFVFSDNSHILSRNVTVYFVFSNNSHILSRNFIIYFIFSNNSHILSRNFIIYFIFFFKCLILLLLSQSCQKLLPWIGVERSYFYIEFLLFEGINVRFS